MRLEELVGGKIIYIYDGSKRDGIVAFIIEKDGRKYAVEVRSSFVLLFRVLDDS